ncbi:unnamed protein product [Amoebophrya sp. A25]|nr:unnamed protein product [Amoebophrya sp. A25]|eukprot:GSA25T00007585001.1
MLIGRAIEMGGAGKKPVGVQEPSSAYTRVSPPTSDAGSSLKRRLFCCSWPSFFRSNSRCIGVVLLIAGIYVVHICLSGWWSGDASRFDYVVPADRQPIVDERRYGYRVFPNGLRYLAIEDATSRNAALSVLVEAGSLRNPDDVEGVAHLLEHTVLIGSENFPGKTQWDDFQEKYLGNSNAFTADDKTVYYIGLTNDGLEGAFERTADFMFRPTLTADSEINAVEAEHEKNIQSPGWRINSLRDFVFDPQGLGRFSTGNRATLQRPTIIQDLKQFHSRWYHPSLMTVVSVSPDPLSVQLARATKYFGQESNPRTPYVDPRPYIVNPQYGRYIHMFDENSPTPRLQLQFPIEMDFRPYYRSGLGAYFNHLLNFEGYAAKQGLQGYMLDQGWIFGSGFGVSASNYLTTLSFSASLRHPQFAEQVVNEFWRYMKVVKQEVRMDVYQAIEKVSAFSWKWNKVDGDRADLATDYCELLSDNHPPEDLLMSGKIQMDPDIVRRVLTDIVPERMQILITEKQGSPDGTPEEGWPVKTLRYYGVKYTEGFWDISSQVQKIVAEKPSVPNYGYTLPNPLQPPPVIDYTPEHFAQQYSKEYPFGPSPERLEGTIWYRWGSTTREPQFKFFMRFFARMTWSYAEDPAFERHAAFRTLWGHMLARKLAPVMDEAETCSVGIGIDGGFENLMSIQVSVGGYYSAACDTQLQKVLDVFFKLEEGPSKGAAVSLRGTDLVGRVSEALYLDLTDHTSSMPFRFATSALGTVNGENGITGEALVVTVKEVRDQNLAKIGREALPEANGLLKTEEYIVGPNTQLPEHLAEKSNSAGPKKPSGLFCASCDLVSIAAVDRLQDTVVRADTLYADGMAFGGITKGDARRLRDTIVARFEAERRSPPVANAVSASTPGGEKKGIVWDPIPGGKVSRRSMKHPIDLQVHTKRLEDSNDVTLVRLVKNSKRSVMLPDGSVKVDLQEVFTHRMLGVMFGSFTFTRLRTLVLEKQGKQRYVVSGSIGGSGVNFGVDVMIQTTKEDLQEVMKEIENHIYIEFGKFLDGVTEAEFETRRRSILQKLSSKGDSFGSEMGHFAGVLDEPRTEGKELRECHWQLQWKKIAAVKRLTLAETRLAWRDFLDKSTTVRKQVVLHHDLNKPLDPRKTVASYQAAKKNPENVDWYPRYGGIRDCDE